MKKGKRFLSILTCVTVTAVMMFQGVAVAAGPEKPVSLTDSSRQGEAVAAESEKPASLTDSSWQEEIEEMLDAGEHVKGEVIAGVVPEDSLPEGVSQAGDNAQSASEKLISRGEKLMDTSAVSDEMQIIRIKSSMSTEKILQTLKTNKRVLFAEPNYITEQESISAADQSQSNIKDQKSISQAEQSQNSSGGSLVKSKSEQSQNNKTEQSLNSNAGSIGNSKIYSADQEDATNLQWGNFSGAELKTSASLDPSIHVPKFGSTGSNMKNRVIVAVIDHAVDYKHPDLKNVVYRFSAKQQKKLKCGEYGYNANQKNGKLHFYEEGEHGTHCAGILGASWDGKGISGVASKAKIISVQNTGADGRTSLSCDLRAFDFVKRAKQSGIDIRITSNSWGIDQSSKAINAAAYELGKKYGIVSFFAAGNDGKDNINANMIEWTLNDNPYVVIVSATDMNDQLAVFSSYGVDESTLGAPGSKILSSVLSSCAQYIPDMSKKTNKFYEGFEEASPKVTIRQLDKNNKPVGSPAVKVKGQAAFSGSSSFKLDLDKKYFIPTEDGMRIAKIEMDLGDLSGKNIKSGDTFRFSVAGKKTIDCPYCKFTQTGEGEAQVMAEWAEYSALWFSPFCDIPENTDVKNMKAEIQLQMKHNANNTIYIDSIGIGSQLVPYAFLDGTSMATPQVAGAAAVLAGNNSKLRGAALAKKITSMTRPNKSLKGKTKTGGILDFKAISAAKKVKAGPVITSLKVKSKKVIIKGSKFGTKKGKVQVYKFVTGKKDAKKRAKIKKWTSGKIELKLSKKFKGIMKLTVTNANGRSFTYHKFISKSKNVYKSDLPFSKKTGKPFKIGAQGDYETDGPLQAIKGKLYYLPQLTRTEQTPACKKLMRYDIKKKKWSKLPALPQWLENVSVAAYKGKLIVKGTKMKKAFDGSPVHIEDFDNANSRIYVFDPKKYSKLKKKKGKTKKAWTRASHKKVKITATILNRKGQLMLAGGCDYTKMPSPGQRFAEDTSDLVKYSLKKGAGKRLLKFGSLVDNPSVAVKGKKICILDNANYRVFIVNGSRLIKLKNALPSYVMTGVDRGDDFSISERAGIVVPAKKGFVLVGPAAKSGSSDTFLLKKGSKKFKAMKKRASDARVIAPAAAAYKGRLYVIAASALEKGKRFFRSTKL